MTTCKTFMCCFRFCAEFKSANWVKVKRPKSELLSIFKITVQKLPHSVQFCCHHSKYLLQHASLVALLTRFKRWVAAFLSALFLTNQLTTHGKLDLLKGYYLKKKGKDGNRKHRSQKELAWFVAEGIVIAFISTCNPIVDFFLNQDSKKLHNRSSSSNDCDPSTQNNILFV